MPIAFYPTKCTPLTLRFENASILFIRLTIQDEHSLFNRVLSTSLLCFVLVFLGGGGVSINFLFGGLSLTQLFLWALLGPG